MDDNAEKHILIVDDKKENLDLLTAICKRFGYKQILAQSGEESIAIMESRNDIMLVLMDVKMQGIGGINAMKSIKEKHNVPVIAVTGFAMDDDKEKYVSQGFDDYISKPIDIQLLIQKIKTLTGTKQ